MKRGKILEVKKKVPYEHISVAQAKDFYRTGIDCICNGNEGVVELVFKAKFKG